MLSLQARLGTKEPWRIRDWGPLGCFLENKGEIWALVPLYNHSWRWFKLIALANTHAHTLAQLLFTKARGDSKGAVQSASSELVCLMDQLYTWPRFTRGILDEPYIFAGGASPVGLPSDRLTGSFFGNEHTEVKEKEPMRGCCPSYLLSAGEAARLSIYIQA